MKTQVTVISDTHTRHAEIALAPGDLLIHCGDMLNLGTGSPPAAPIDDWFGRQAYERILYTGGNHDRALEAALVRSSQPMRNAHYLGGELVEVRGLKIYGAPWVPELRSHAFYRDRAALAAAWARVPAGIDILVTHTPPREILDTSSRGRSLGCAALAAELQRIAPRVHCFGHVHASGGWQTVGETMFINAASIDSGTGKMRRPISFTIAPRDS